MSNQTFLETALLAEHSKAQTTRIVRWIGADAGRLSAMMEIFLGDEYRLTQRGAWVVRYVAEKHPELMAPYFPMLIAALDKAGIHDAVKRNVLNVFEPLEISAEYHEILLDHCFRYLADPQEPIAIRCASMTILGKICQEIPELKDELRMILEEHLEFGSAGFKSRAKRVLKSL
jgi:hypothetical protein